MVILNKVKNLIASLSEQILHFVQDDYSTIKPPPLVTATKYHRDPKMRRLIITLAVLIISANYSFSQTFDNNRLIVFGGVEISAPADNARFTFEVEGVGSTLADAVEKARSKVSSIAKALFEIGLTERNLRTSFFYSGENFEDKALLTSKRDYKAGISVIVNIDNLNHLEAAIIQVSESKPEKISNIVFTLQDYEKLKEEALEKAVQKARSKAQLMAANMETNLGDVLYIEELPSRNPSRGYISSSPFNASISSIPDDDVSIVKTGAGFYAEEIKINARVKVIVELSSGATNK